MTEDDGKIEFVSEPCPIKPRKIIPQNIVIRLCKRETFGCPHPGTHVLNVRQFYQNVFPNFTIVNVEKPPCFLRKFSPDGKYLLAFSADQTSIGIYEYRGASAAADVLAGCKGDYIGHNSDERSFNIRSNIFNKFFKVTATHKHLSNSSEMFEQRDKLIFLFLLQIRWIVNVFQSNEQLNRECSLFTDDGRYVIVGSAAHIPDELRPHFYQVILGLILNILQCSDKLNFFFLTFIFLDLLKQ